MGFGIGTSSVASRLFGADKRDDVARVTLHAMLLGAVTGGAVLIVGLSTIDPLFTLLGADENTLPLIHRYMRINYWGGIFLVIPMIANSVLRASGDAKTPAMIMATAAILNVVVDPILIFGLFGFPRLEVEGAAISTVLANAGAMIASISFLYFRENLIEFTSIAPELILDSWRRILHVGIPSITSSLVAPLTTAFITYQVAQFGQEAVAGFGVASRIEGLSLLALMALSGAVTPFVGQNFGAGIIERVRAGTNWCFRFALLYGLGIATIIGLGSSFIAGLFTDDPQATSTATMHMRIVPISYFALGTAMTVNSAFNGIGKPLPGMVVSLCRTILVYAPLAFIFAKVFGLIGVFAAACTANFVAGSIGFAWFRTVLGLLIKEREPVATT